MSVHPAIAANHLAVITGGASGIGLAAATAYASKFGMNVAIGDIVPDAELQRAVAAVQSEAKQGSKVFGHNVDVGDRKSVEAFSKEVQTAFPSSPLTVLMSNAGVGGPTKASDWAGWERILHVNMYGVINSVQTFLPQIKTHKQPSLIINTGSKQGITTPPGTGPAYNASKAVVKVFTEQLAAEMRGDATTKVIEPKLLIPGWVFTGLTGAKDGKAKPDGAWSAEQTVDYMFDQIKKGSFYILCPDNETPKETDLKRMEWNVNDVLQDRPPLSRWHPDHSDAFNDFMKK
ncbi:NAD(P)-binding protein [Acaromyces ingoldii]|uniref:NAD(P)-binding protein n=1 Tax=Acaromyces ingoldii TaxID=215250 RepID=A0A316YLZ8_9BASI|nr:NAD(P)-binding protein [Acaromyces ingoldii]PWN90182.1 NAD(P)-binding protein [Acaromyces ingoldii]